MSGSDTPAPARSGRKPQALGRGLSALFAETKRESIGGTADGEGADGVSVRDIQNIDIAAIRPHPDQPRRHFDDASLQELTDSIAARGVIQPIIVRTMGSGAYQIVAGERRWRAAQRAQLHQIPAIIREFDETETLEIAIVENVQREDLNPMEEARAYRRLVDHFGHSQEAVGRLVGKSRSHVANLMRLLDLPGEVQDLVMAGSIGMGHARALIGVKDSEALARQAADRNLSVRDVEKLVRSQRDGRPEHKSSPGPANSNDADIAALERDLGDLLGMRISIGHDGSGRGSVTVHYSTLDQLDMLCQRLSGEAI